jgi:hypothetical protein
MGLVAEKVTMNEANKKVDVARGKCQVGMPLDEGSGDSASPASLEPSDEGSAQEIHPVRCLWSPWSALVA